MLQPALGTVTFGDQFSVTITIVSESTSIDPVTGLPVTTTTPSTVVPTVTRSFNDPGVTVTTAPGSVTIAGAYQTIIPITWHYLDLAGAEQTAPSAPAVGTFKKIVQVDSPPTLTQTCTYTITTDSAEQFVHTVTLGSYDVVANKLKSLLATV